MPAMGLIWACYGPAIYASYGAAMGMLLVLRVYRGHAMHLVIGCYGPFMCLQCCTCTLSVGCYGGSYGLATGHHFGCVCIGTVWGGTGVYWDCMGLYAAVLDSYRS